MRIIGLCNPFSPEFIFQVYGDDEQVVEELRIKNFSGLGEAVLRQAKNYNVTDINIVGPKTYNTGIKKAIENAELTKYSTNNIKVTLL